MADEMTIPVLPCVSLADTVDFYMVLGFEVTHKQRAPYVYLAMRRGGIHLHFHGREGLAANEANGGICLWMIPDGRRLEELHRSFVEALRRRYGKLPVAGIPRISRLRKGQRRFTVVDPSGNSVILIQVEGAQASANDAQASAKETPQAAREPKSRLARAITSAEHTRVSQNDDALAAEVLDIALARNDPAPAIDRARALAMRMELAVALGDKERVERLRAERDAVVLSDEERERFRDELQAAEELERLVD
ncbi:hypothetical protein [Pendulispora albinea]|uniref:Glyoxalase n=1 Tax=Pendulispora albinea TaxID=2741071 RepID=A0ABZ2LYB1_9BACT